MKKKDLLLIATMGLIIPLAYPKAQAGESVRTCKQVLTSYKRQPIIKPENIMPADAGFVRGLLRTGDISREDHIFNRWRQDQDRKKSRVLDSGSEARLKLAELIFDGFNSPQKINETYLNESLFIVPANDGEALMAIDVLAKVGAPFLQVSSQGWGAVLGAERIKEVVLDKVKRVVVFEMPSAEVEEYLKSIGLEVVIVDHHIYASQGLDRYKDTSSLEQLAELIGYSLSADELAVAVNDQDYISGLKRLGLNEGQIRAVRRYDLSAQGKWYSDIIRSEQSAIKYLETAKKINGVYILEDTRGLTPYIYQELGIRSEDGFFNAVEFKEPNKVGFSGSKEFAAKLMAIDFESFGYPKNSYDVYAAGGGTLMGFKLKDRVNDAYVKFEDLKTYIMGMINTEVSLAESEYDKAKLPVVNEVNRILEEAGDQPIELGDINFKVFGGENAEPLVLIHGLDSAHQTFENIFEELSQKYRLIVIDQRGHGASADKSIDFSSMSMAGDLKRVLDHLGVKKAHVLGHSMGARTATKFASMFPEIVKSLMIEDMDLFARIDQERLLNIDVKKEIFERAASIKAEFDGKIFANRQALVDALTPYFGDEAGSVAQRRATENPDGTMRLLFRPWITGLYGFQGNLEDFTNELSQIKVPILVMQADPEKGSAMTEEGVRHISESASDVSVELFSGAGHTIHRADKEKFLSVLTEFVDKVIKETQFVKRIEVRNVGYTTRVEKEGMLPRGSALITSSGDLEKKGITAIVHAASGSMGKSGGEFEPNLFSIRSSVINSIALARENGHTRVAIPFIGGAIFAQRIGVEPKMIAEAIGRAVSYMYNRGIEIRIVTFGDNDTNLFKEVLRESNELHSQIKREGSDLDPAALVLNGSLTDFDLHRASAIVNAANMEVIFGGGLSGIIAKETGDAEAINAEAQKVISDFYESVEADSLRRKR